MGQLPRSTSHRQSTISGSMLPGNAGGRTSVIGPEPAPLPSPAMLQDRTVHIPLANAGPMSAGRSTPYNAPYDGFLTDLVVTARDTAAGDSTFQVRVNDVLVGNVVTLPSGSASVVGDVGFIHVDAQDVIDVQCLTAGSGLGDVGGYVELAA